MKTINRYTQITPAKALELLARSGGRPVQDMAFRDSDCADWAASNLLAVDPSDDAYTFKSNITEEYFTHCAAVHSVFPNETPQGVPDLPEPFLVYAGRGRDIPNDLRYGWAYWTNKVEWVHDDIVFHNARGNNNPNVDVHYAIDVRTQEAKTHFPELVAALEYPDKQSIEKQFLHKRVRIEHSRLNEALGHIGTPFPVGSTGTVTGVDDSQDIELNVLMDPCDNSSSTTVLQHLGPNQVEIVSDQSLVGKTVRITDDSCTPFKVGDTGIVLRVSEYFGDEPSACEVMMQFTEETHGPDTVITQRLTTDQLEVVPDHQPHTEKWHQSHDFEKVPRQQGAMDAFRKGYAAGAVDGGIKTRAIIDAEE